MAAPASRGPTSPGRPRGSRVRSRYRHATVRQSPGARRLPACTHPWRRYRGLHDAVSPGESVSGPGSGDQSPPRAPPPILHAHTVQLEALIQEQPNRALPELKDLLATPASPAHPVSRGAQAGLSHQE